MAFLTEAEARAVGESVAYGRRKTASEALLETASVSSAASRFDIFLSHSTLDAKVILGVKTILERMGKTVYVDWIHDKQLDREKVSRYGCDAQEKNGSIQISFLRALN